MYGDGRSVHRNAFYLYNKLIIVIILVRQNVSRIQGRKNIVGVFYNIYPVVVVDACDNIDVFIVLIYKNCFLVKNGKVVGVVVVKIQHKVLVEIADLL